MRTDKTASHICYELDHDVQEYAKRLLAKKILHAAQQNNAAPLSDKTAKKTAETAVFLTERLALLYELNSGFRGIRFSTFGEQPAVYTTMVQHNAPLYDELMLGRALLSLRICDEWDSLQERRGSIPESQGSTGRTQTVCGHATGFCQALWPQCSYPRKLGRGSGRRDAPRGDG